MPRQHSWFTSKVFAFWTLVLFEVIWVQSSLTYCVWCLFHSTFTAFTHTHSNHFDSFLFLTSAGLRWACSFLSSSSSLCLRVVISGKSGCSPDPSGQTLNLLSDITIVEPAMFHWQVGFSFLSLSFFVLTFFCSFFTFFLPYLFFLPFFLFLLFLSVAHMFVWPTSRFLERIENILLGLFAWCKSNLVFLEIHASALCVNHIESFTTKF